MGSQESIVLVGGGGHCKVLIDLIQSCGKYDITGITDPQLGSTTKILDVPVLGGDDLLEQILKDGTKNAAICVGGAGDNTKRGSLFDKAKEIGFSMPCLIHPAAIVSKHAHVGDGVQIMAGAVLQTASFIGENTILNSGSIIEHDCRIGGHVHVCPGAVILGGCVVGDGVFIGAGATVLQGVEIGSQALVACGSAVIANVDDRAVVKGVPAR